MPDIPQRTGFGRFVDDMPSWAKGIAIVGGLGLTAWLTIHVYSDIKARKRQKQANADGERAQTDLNALAQNGVQPSYVQSSYSDMAKTLQIALNGCNINKDSIKSVIGKMKNTADVLSLITAFGARGIEPCWMNPIDVSCGTIGWIGYKLGVNKGTVVSLPQALQIISQGSGVQLFIDTVGFVDELNVILRSNNVNYQF